MALRGQVCKQLGFKSDMLLLQDGRESRGDGRRGAEPAKQLSPPDPQVESPGQQGGGRRGQPLHLCRAAGGRNRAPLTSQG